MSDKTNQLNKIFEKKRIEERIRWIFEHYHEDEVLLTSSFGSSSALLLHLVNKIKPQHPVYFLDTGYHFQDTIEYKDELVAKLHLNVKVTGAARNKHTFTRENYTYHQNQDLCCFINKVEPLAALRTKHKIWLSGLFRYQNENRKNLNFFEEKDDILKCSPLLDMSPEEVHTYFFIHELPSHPMVSKGFGSIGCTHCTAKGNGRDGRWKGQAKTECGIHM